MRTITFHISFTLFQFFSYLCLISSNTQILTQPQVVHLIKLVYLWCSILCICVFVFIYKWVIYWARELNVIQWIAMWLKIFLKPKWKFAFWMFDDACVYSTLWILFIRIPWKRNHRFLILLWLAAWIRECIFAFWNSQWRICTYSYSLNIAPCLFTVNKYCYSTWIRAS